MPLYFRKRPGSKNIKANITQRGLRSLTFTSGSKKGQPRLNFNTSRGWSFSFPGTGLMWRQKGYGNSKSKSVVEERGYDLRTREGRARHADEQTTNFVAGLCTFVSIGMAWLFDSAYGLWAGYILFWLITLFTHGAGFFIWATCAHVGGAAGYLVSMLVKAKPEELILWGIVFGTLLSALIMRTVIPTIISLWLLIGIWATFGEPSIYFAEIPNRVFSVTLSLSPTEFFAWFGDKFLPLLVGTAIAIVNGLSCLALLYGLWLWGWIIFNVIDEWALNFFLKFLAKIIGAILFLISFGLTMVTGILLGILADSAGFSSNSANTFYNNLGLYFILIGFSVTSGIFVNRAILLDRDIRLGYFASVLMCLPGAFWLPRFMVQSVHHNILQEAPAEKAISSGQVQKKAKTKSKSVNSKKSVVKNKNTTAANSPVRYYYRTAFISVTKKISALQKSRLEALVGLGEKRLTSIYSSYPDLCKILNESDQIFRSKTGLGSSLTKRVKFALTEAEQTRDKEVLSEFLKFLFPTKKSKVKILLSRFSSFDELLRRVDKSEMEIDGLTANDLDTIKRLSKIQIIN